jgi:hypothetical protein
LLAVTVNQGTWSGQLKAKIDPSDGNCQNSGNYYFKVQRFTIGGSGNFDDQNSLSVNISIPTPTPTPTSVPTDTPTPASNAATATPTPKPTATPTPKPTVKPVSSVAAASSGLATKTSGVLGGSSQSAVIQIPTVKPKTIEIASQKSNNLLPQILIFIGIVFLVACAIVVSYPYLKNLRKKNSDE